jgi:hypothetical protein
MAKNTKLSPSDIQAAQEKLMSSITPKAEKAIESIKAHPPKKERGVKLTPSEAKYAPDAYEASKGILPPPSLVLLSGGIIQTMNETSNADALSRRINNMALDTSASQSNQSTSQQIKAMIQNYAEASPVNELLWELGARSGSNYDEQFVKNKSFEMQQQALLDNGLELNDANYKMINNANSQSDFNFRLDELKKRNDVNQYINNTIGSFQQGVSSFLGQTLGDPSIGLSIASIPSAIAKLGLAARTATAFGSSVALQGTIAAVKNEYLSDYTTQDAVLDTIIGGGIDGLLAKGLFKKSLNGDFVNPNTMALAIDRNRLSSSLALQSNANRFDLTTQYRWNANRPRQLADAFTDVEIIERAKELGQDTALAITDKNIRGKIADDLRNTSRAKADNVVASVLDAVADFKKGNTNKIDALARTTKLTREQISEMAKTLPDDIKGIREEITAIGNQKAGKARAAMASNMNKIIEAISEVDMDVAQSLNHDLNLAMGKTKDRVIKDKTGVAFIKGKASAMEAVENLSNAIQKTFDNMTEAAMEVRNFKNLKPIKTAKGLSKESADRLNAIDEELGALRKRRASKNFSKEDKANAVKKLEDEADAISKDSKLNTPNKDRDRVVNNLARQKEMYERMASAMDELTLDFKTTLEDIINENYFTKADKDAFLDEITRVINDALESNVSFKMTDDGIEVTGAVRLIPDGKGNVATKNGKMKLALATALALSATGAFASDGENSGIDFGTVMLIIIAGSIGIVKAPSLIKAMKSTYKNVTSVEQVAKDATDPVFKKNESLNEKIAEVVRSELMESMYRVIKNGTQQSADIANMLVENIVDYTGRNVEGQRRAKTWAANARMHKAMHTAFMEHLAETGATQSIFTRVRNAIGLSPEEVKFQESVIDFVENGGDASASISKGAAAYKKERDLMTKELNESGAYGFDDESISGYKDTHVARLYQQKNIADIAATTEGRQSLEDFFTNAIHSGRKGKAGDEADLLKSRKAASKLIDSITSGGMEHMGRASVDRYLEAMEAIGIDISHIDRDILAAEAHFASDIISRGKNRIPMDLRKWEDFKVTIDGEEKLVSLGTIFDRQASSIIEKLAHQQYGISELARQTKYKSFNELMSDIASEPNKEVRKVLETYAKSLTGRALLDYGSAANMAVGAAKQMTSVALLTSLTTTFKEVKDVVGAMFGKGGSSVARKEMLFGIRNTVMRIVGESVYDGKHTALADELLYSVNGHGGSRIRKELHIRGADELTGGYEDISSGTLQTGANIAGRIGIMISQLMAADDFFKRIAGIYATTRLARVVHGIETMSEAQIKRYGLTPENAAKLKKVLKLNGDNEVERLGFDNWDADTQDIFRQLTDRIIMHRSTWVTLGGINTSLINNEAGRLISSMAMFMNQTYTSQFVAGVKHMDADEVMNQMALFSAGFISYSAKSVLTGKEQNAEDAAINSLMMSPMMAPFGLVGMAYDPVALSVIDRTIKTAKGMMPSEYE